MAKSSLSSLQRNLCDRVRDKTAHENSTTTPELTETQTCHDSQEDQTDCKGDAAQDCRLCKFPQVATRDKCEYSQLRIEANDDC